MTLGKRFAIVFSGAGVLVVAVQAFFVFGQLSYSNEIKVSATREKSLFQAQLLNAVQRDFTLVDNEQKISYDIDSITLQSWIKNYFQPQLNRRVATVDFQKIKEYIISMPITIARQPVNGRLAIGSDGEIIETVASIEGLVLNPDKTANNIVAALKNGQNWAQIHFDGLTPKLSLEKAANIGVNALLARGESNFSGSPQSRIHNITVGAAVYNGLILKPGEEFSFNNLLGAVDASTGYKQELIVKDHKIMTDYGGGLCQVSTTIFRAAMIAGLPITERHNHSLALKYYSPQGFDATIYPGVSDLRFVNDTLGNILIQTEVKGTSLYFDLFGVKDGRQVALDGPRTLLWDPDGSMKTILNRTITYADGMVNKNSFYSEFSPAALYPMANNPLE